MNGTELRECRVSMGYSQGDLGATLGLGASGGRSVRRWEAGAQPVPGPVALAVRALSEGWRPGDTGMADLKTRCRNEITVFLQVARDAMEHLENSAAAALSRIDGE